MATPNEVARQLRTILKDYNNIPLSESDAPLKISIFKGVIDEAKTLKIDSRLRINKNEENGAVNYKTPDIRTVDIKTLDEVFNPLIFNAIDNVVSTKNNIMNGLSQLESLLLPVQNVEQLVQLYSVFKRLSNVVVKKIEAIGEVYVTLLIIGEMIDSGSVTSIYANTVLVQT